MDQILAPARATVDDRRAARVAAELDPHGQVLHVQRLRVDEGADGSGVADETGVVRLLVGALDTGRGNARDRFAEAVHAKWAGHQINQVHFIRPRKSMSQIGG